MIGAMAAGAAILLFGMALGAVAMHFYKRPPKPVPKLVLTAAEEPKDKPYDKFRNKDGLFSPRAVRERR